MIRRLVRSLRRAPGRLLVSTFALALAVAAIGVFAIPSVAASSLREAAIRDGVANIVLETTDTGSVDLDRTVGALDGVEVVEPQIVVDLPVRSADDESAALRLVGVAVGGQRIDILHADEGRLPIHDREVLVPDDGPPIGSRIPVESLDGHRSELEVVGIGGTSFFEGDDVAFSTIETASDLAGLVGVNRISIGTTDSSGDALRSTSDDLRAELATHGISLEDLPVTIEDGIHPIEAEIEQISMLIGLLGIVAGIVGLVLLASTTNTLIVERTREVAVMRALGAAPRALRRRLRRIAMGIALAAVVIGVPLGVVFSNVIARLVLQEFVGLTPDVAVSMPVIAASAAFALVGARLVAARAARRVTARPLADALRDRDGSPFGRRRLERISMHWSAGTLLGRTALRQTTHRWARSVAIAVQVGAAVAALLIVSSMATTINDFNDAELAPWRWESTTYVAGPGLDIDAAIVAGDPQSEAAIEVTGEVQEWEVDVFGFEPDTRMLDRTMADGSWFERPGDVVVSRGFADHLGITVGDRIDVSLATGRHTYAVSGLHPNRGRELYLDRTELAADLGRSDGANRILSLDPDATFDLAGVTGVDRFDDLESDDSGRTAILLIFGAIGVVVVSVAGLAVASGLAVNIYERRRELAAIQAIGGRRRHLVRLVATEVLLLGGRGLGIGLVGGYLGARAIARSFEISNAVQIDFVFSSGVVPLVIAVVLVGLLALSVAMVRPATARPIAQTLRQAA